MHRMRRNVLVTAASALALSPLVIFAWTGPTQSPPNGNVAAPINVGTTAQVKNGGLGVNALSVFGNSLFGGSAGSNAYLNFGATGGTNGYGIRDNGGLLEFKNSGGDWASIQSTIFNLCSGGACGGGGGGSGTPVAFNVGKGPVQYVGQGIGTVLTWENEIFDTNNNFANNRFTPTVAGKYIVHLSVYCSDSSAYCWGRIYKNGTIVNQQIERGATAMSAVTAIVDMNGTTDYLYAEVVNLGGTTISGGLETNFSGSILSPQSGGGGGGSWATSGNNIHNTNTGNVGIGTESPVANLEIVGSLRVGNGNSHAGYEFDSESDDTSMKLEYFDFDRHYYSTVALFGYDGTMGLGMHSVGSGYKLAVNGGVGATVFYNLSDRSLKTNIKPLSGALSKVLQLQGVSFNWKDPNQPDPQIGFIAQDVEKIVPELTSTNGNTGLKSVDYARVAPLLVEALKEQQKEIESMKSDNSALKRDIEELRSTIGSGR